MTDRRRQPRTSRWVPPPLPDLSDLRHNYQEGYRIYIVSKKFFARSCWNDLPMDYHGTHVPIAVPNPIEHLLRGMAIDDVKGLSYISMNGTKSYPETHLFYYRDFPDDRIGLPKFVLFHADGSCQFVDKDTGPGQFLPLARLPHPSGDYRNWFREKPHVLFYVRSVFFQEFSNATYPTVPGHGDHYPVVVPIDRLEKFRAIAKKVADWKHRLVIDLIGNEMDIINIWAPNFEGVIQMLRGDYSLFRAVYKDRIGDMAYPQDRKRADAALHITPIGGLVQNKQQHQQPDIQPPVWASNQFVSYPAGHLVDPKPPGMGAPSWLPTTGMAPVFELTSRRPTSTATSGALERRQDNQPPIRPRGVVPYPFSRPSRTGTETVGGHPTSRRTRPSRWGSPVRNSVQATSSGAPSSERVPQRTSRRQDNGRPSTRPWTAPRPDGGYPSFDRVLDPRSRRDASRSPVRSSVPTSSRDSRDESARRHHQDNPRQAERTDRRRDDARRPDTRDTRHHHHPRPPSRPAARVTSGEQERQQQEGRQRNLPSARPPTRGPSDDSTDRQNSSTSIFQVQVQDEATERGKQGSASGRRSPPSGGKGSDRKRSKK